MNKEIDSHAAAHAMSEHASVIATELDVNAAAILLNHKSKTAVYLSSCTSMPKKNVVIMLREMGQHMIDMSKRIESGEIKPDNESEVWSPDKPKWGDISFSE